MKKIYLLIGIAFTTFAVSKVSAQNFVDNYGNKVPPPPDSIIIESWHLENTINRAKLNTDNIFQNGNVGIGNFSTSSPTQNLDVNGNMRVRTFANGTDRTVFPNRVVAMPDGTFGYSPVGQPWNVIFKTANPEIEASLNTQNIKQSGHVQIGTDNVSVFPNANAVINGDAIDGGNLAAQLMISTLSTTVSNPILGFNTLGVRLAWWGLDRVTGTMYWNTEAVGWQNRVADAKMLLDINGLLSVKFLPAQPSFFPRIILTGNATAATLTLVGNLSVPSATLTGNLSAASATFTGNMSSASTTTTSDARLKRNILPIDNALEIVNALKPVHYEKKDKLAAKNYTLKEYGFIAQDLEKVLPEIVQTDNSVDHIKSVNYTDIIAILTKALQEQQNTIKLQKKEINSLKSASL